MTITLTGVPADCCFMISASFRSITDALRAPDDAKLGRVESKRAAPNITAKMKVSFFMTLFLGSRVNRISRVEIRKRRAAEGTSYAHCNEADARADTNKNG